MRHIILPFTGPCFCIAEALLFFVANMRAVINPADKPGRDAGYCNLKA